MNRTNRSSLRPFDYILNIIESSKPSDRFILRTLFFFFIGSVLFLLFSFNQQQSSMTPIDGGVFKEGMVGTPRFINPVLATTRVDQDVTALVFDGLMKINAEGDLVPHLAESVTVSEDGLTYNVVMRRDVQFHDGRPLTARDAVFTIQTIQNPDLKSPLRGNWNGVMVEEVNEYEFNIVLEEAYAPFIENFQFGILPAHLWSNLPIEQIPFSQLNTEPIGSGPFRMDTVVRDRSGIITSITLEAFRNNPTSPNIDTFEVHFFNEEQNLLAALMSDNLDASAYVSNENLSQIVSEGSHTVIRSPLPRVFGVFFNQNRSAALRDPAVREALSLVIDREALIEQNLSGQGFPIFTPVTWGRDGVESEEGSDLPDSSLTRVERAKEILAAAGWRENSRGQLEKQIDGQTETLSIIVRTSNAPLFDAITQSIAKEWQAIGVEVGIEQFEQAGLVQSVIRPRDFQALLFGLDMSRAGDLYPFWHSSQKSDPGLNISQYTNLTVDTILATARTEQNSSSRREKLTEASTIIQEERPAIFLFQPVATYLVRTNAVIATPRIIARPSDRFANVTEWYTDSDSLWNIFHIQNN